MNTTTAWKWGTNYAGGPYYAGRAHVVRRMEPEIAMCGLPVQHITDRRPARPNRLCPECCLLTMALMFPAVEESANSAHTPPAPFQASPPTVPGPRYHHEQSLVSTGRMPTWMDRPAYSGARSAATVV
jgi:hypothetical protein